MNKQIFFSLILTLLSIQCISQIETGKKNGSSKKMNKIILPDSTKTNFVFFSYSRGTSFRKLEITEKFVKNQTQLNNEIKIPTFNLDLSLKSQFKKKYFYNFGLGYQKYGEDFKQEGDTIINYQTRYQALTIPLKVGFQTGKKINCFISTGLQGQMIYEYQKKESITIAGSEKSTSTKKVNHLNSFGIASISNIGIQYNLPIFSFALSGEYIYQLNSIYNQEKGINHKPYFYGVKIGVGMRL